MLFYYVKSDNNKYLYVHYFIGFLIRFFFLGKKYTDYTALSSMVVTGKNSIFIQGSSCKCITDTCLWDSLQTGQYYLHILLNYYLLVPTPYRILGTLLGRGGEFIISISIMRKNRKRKNTSLPFLVVNPNLSQGKKIDVKKMNGLLYVSTILLQ